MEKNMEKIGYVTFADILGWKGIWRNNDYSCLSKIILIKKILDEKKIKLQNNEIFDIINKLEEKVNVKPEIRDKILKIKKEFKPEAAVNFFVEYVEIIVEIITDNHRENKKASEVKEELNLLFNLLEDNYINKEMKEIINEEPDSTFFGKFLKKDSFRSKINELSNLYAEREIYIKIDLISDTFVITSQRKGKISNERNIHLEICRALIIECLKNGLLVRGATAYGKYYNQESVYVGPAIDEAASWHEQADEIGIFLTKSAELQDDKIIPHILTRHTVNIKKGKLEDALVLDWTSGENEFYQKYKNESPFLPEIALKYINSQKFLDKQKKKKLNKIDELRNKYIK